ncbi:helix-turn-helix transcriptional regulator [Candidatus Woesearchaeota archaeon]|jgi:transcriptional regulator with XRE-family HTH domain|nr:helix-turn-helix transcriptional regulator [Candidatus Woesearchaeota archaeon]MBT7558279.1 helix-turn-helix transcriptional regulator [Candidatus Woesearchaeota archaeon]
MNIAKSFGSRLRFLRKEHNISQEKLAELSGLHRTYISSLEQGFRNPTIATLYSIANALNIDISYLVMDIGNK